MLFNKYKIITVISMFALIFTLNTVNAAQSLAIKVSSAITAVQVKSVDAKAIVLAKGQNNLPKRPHHC